MIEVKIDTEYIKLDQFLKFECIASTGGDAKNMIFDGMVKVNDTVELARGKKLKKGDTIEVMDQKYIIV